MLLQHTTALILPVVISQPLGMHMQCGGGQGGFVAAHDDMKYIAEFKDLMFGLTETVKEGEWGFGEVLYDRTSYGSREKGKEYTGTTTGLLAITAGVYLSLMGPRGMEEVSQTIMQKSQYAALGISQIAGLKLAFPTPFFKNSSSISMTPVSAWLKSTRD